MTLQAFAARAARCVFEQRGGHHEAHLTEADLAGNFEALLEASALPPAAINVAAPALLDLAKRDASECGECNGTGETVGYDSGDDHIPGGSCAECADIRAVIAQAEGRA